MGWGTTRGSNDGATGRLAEAFQFGEIGNA